MGLKFGTHDITKLWFDDKEISTVWDGEGRVVYSSAKGTLLGELPTGSIVKVKENGVLADFAVAQHNYIQSGVTAIERVLCLSQTVAFNSANVNTFNGGTLDTYLTTTYRGMLEQSARDALMTVNIPVTPGNGNYTVTTIPRDVFVFSGTEVGLANQYMIIEGSKVPIYTDNASRIKYSDGAPTTARNRWTRSAYSIFDTNPNRVWRVGATGFADFTGNAASAHYIAPVLTLSSTTLISDTGEIL